MALSSVQTNEYSRKKSYFKSAAVGAIAGYTLKWAAPVTKAEKDKNFYCELKRIARKISSKKNKEIEKIRTKIKTIEGADEFLKLYDNKKLNISEIDKLKNPLSNKVLELYVKFNQNINNVKRINCKKLITNTKNLRPTSIFVGIGAGIGFLVAALSNISAIEKENSF